MFIEKKPKSTYAPEERYVVLALVSIGCSHNMS